jgi:arylsulfatase A-like enzyme
MGLTRRQFLGVSAVAALGAGAGALVLSNTRGAVKRAKPLADTPPKLASGKKNVIVVLTDSMRRDAMGAYTKNSMAQTPNLDKFTQSGVMFSNAYLCSFPTVLARHDILTATPTCTYKRWSPLDAGTLTLPTVLESHGVHTALIADTRAPYVTDPQPPHNFNYQRDFRYFYQVHGQGHDDLVTLPGGEVIHTENLPFKGFPCDKRKLRDPNYAYKQYLKNVSTWNGEEYCFCAQSCTKAIQWLNDNHARQPFFLFLDVYDPHESWDAPQYYVDHYDRGYTGEEIRNPRYDYWRNYMTERELKHCKALYAAEAELSDHWVGRFLDTVSKLELLDNTLVIHLSDHGTYLGEHGYVGKDFIRDRDTLKDDLGQNKVNEAMPLYPAICRIPMAAHYPGCKPGTVRDGLVQPVNLAGMVLDYLDIPKPREFTEPSAWPLLKGDVKSISDKVICSTALSDESFKLPRPTNRPTITDGRWLLVYACAGWADELQGHPHVDPRYPKRTCLLSGQSLDPQLYDLKADADCSKNIFADNRAIAENLHHWMVNYINQSPMRVDHRKYFWDLEPGSRDVD